MENFSSLFSLSLTTCHVVLHSLRSITPLETRIFPGWVQTLRASWGLHSGAQQGPPSASHSEGPWASSWQLLRDYRLRNQDTLGAWIRASKGLTFMVAGCHDLPARHSPVLYSGLTTGEWQWLLRGTRGRQAGIWGAGGGAASIWGPGQGTLDLQPNHAWDRFHLHPKDFIYITRIKNLVFKNFQAMTIE